MRPIVFNIHVDVAKRSATGRIANGTRRGRRIKVWFGRNIAGDWHVTRVRLGWHGTSGAHGPLLRVVTSELLREFEVAKRQGRG